MKWIDHYHEHNKLWWTLQDDGDVWGREDELHVSTLRTDKDGLRLNGSIYKTATHS